MSVFDSKQSRALPVVGVLVLAAAIVIILFTGASAINQANIERHLQRFANYISGQAALAGKQANFTYATPNIEGWGFNKHATVSNVVLNFSEKSAPVVVGWSFSTPVMSVVADPASSEGLMFAFPGPVNVSENGQLETVVSFPSPLEYAYSESTENNLRTITDVVHLPSQITLTAAGNEASRVVISYDANPVFRVKATPDDHKREAAYEFHNVTLTAADGAQFTAAAIASRFNEAPGKDNRLEGKYTLKITDFIMRNQDKASKAYNVSVDLASSADMPDAKAETAAAPGNSETEIHDMTLATDDFNVKVTGSISTAADDAMPFGSANVDIDHVQPFLASELLPDPARKIAAAALQKITGQPVETLAHATIPLKRDKNGAFYVGDVTFQTLAASVLTDMMQNAPAAAPAAPTPAPTTPQPAPSPAVPAPGAAAPAPTNDSGPGAPSGEPAKGAM